MQCESYCVYVHTFPNGKTYVGQCKEPVDIRWKNGNGYKTQAVHNAIIKYGWENVSHKIVYSCGTREDAWEKELELIKTLNSNASSGGFGYNMSDGGERGSYGHRHTAEFKNRLHDLNAGKNNRFFGKVHTEETRAKISAGNKGKVVSQESRAKMSKSRSGSNHFQFGKYPSEETRQKISKALKGAANPRTGCYGKDCSNSKSVTCVETGIVYSCLSEIKEVLHIDMGGISKVCLGQRKTAGGYHWLHTNINQ